jgi:hypothetical protein
VSWNGRTGGPRFAAGTVTMPVGSANSYSVTVTFPAGLFTAPPVIVTDSESGTILSTSHDAPSSTGCVVHSFWTDELVHGSGGVVSWVAVQI